ncbi:SpoIIIAH-like family protein [Clostridium sp. MCC353]|uniref:SpoIIIAH-like family protein n=1 Tax=Clostridium sp. MCC353 TaxID=2592646 RepID=UPI001C01DDCE|nr:SpoIIIAH-like family protein [Clostridium sp. MCC353]MBT9778914.1 SpoIIIAH-like family protein [Clostridium sp. MCC353]
MKHIKSPKNVNMKKLFRRNQIIITTLAVMIAAAGYLNYAGKKEVASADPVYEAGMMEISDEDILAENQAMLSKNNDNLQEIPSWDVDLEEAESVAQTDGSADSQATGESLADASQGTETGLENPGEAVLTSGMSVTDYIANVQLSREQIRAKNKETLLGIINNTNIEEAAKQQAIQDMLKLTEVSEKENAAETLLMAKGFSDPVVSVTSGKVDVVINAVSITDQQRAQIEDIVKRKTEVTADNIVITLLNLEE